MHEKYLINNLLSDKHNPYFLNVLNIIFKFRKYYFSGFKVITISLI